MYSNDFKAACVRLHAYCKSCRKVASLIGSSASSVCRWIKTNFETVHVRKEHNHKCSISLDAISLLIESNPLTTIREVHDALKVLGMNVSNELVRLAMKKAGYSWKKARFYPTPSNTLEKTNAFLQKRSTLSSRLIIPIDETGFSSNVRPTYGYAKRGKRLHIKYLPSATEKRHTSVVAAADPRNGNVYTKTVDGHFTRTSFLEFLQGLRFPKRTILLMDNVSFHHCKEVCDYIAYREWSVLYTPPYSPWFNPIERVFSVVKANFRRHRNIQRAFDDLQPNIVRSILSSRCIE